jgi:hypothetical protein
MWAGFLQASTPLHWAMHNKEWSGDWWLRIKWPWSRLMIGNKIFQTLWISIEKKSSLSYCKTCKKTTFPVCGFGKHAYGINSMNHCCRQCTNRQPMENLQSIPSLGLSQSGKLSCHR